MKHVPENSVPAALKVTMWNVEHGRATHGTWQQGDLDHREKSGKLYPCALCGSAWAHLAPALSTLTAFMDTLYIVEDGTDIIDSRQAQIFQGIVLFTAGMEPRTSGTAVTKRRSSWACTGLSLIHISEPTRPY